MKVSLFFTYFFSSLVIVVIMSSFTTAHAASRECSETSTKGRSACTTKSIYFKMGETLKYSGVTTLIQEIGHSKPAGTGYVRIYRNASKHLDIKVYANFSGSVKIKKAGWYKIRATTEYYKKSKSSAKAKIMKKPT